MKKLLLVAALYLAVIGGFPYLAWSQIGWSLEIEVGENYWTGLKGDYSQEFCVSETGGHVAYGTLMVKLK